MLATGVATSTSWPCHQPWAAVIRRAVTRSWFGRLVALLQKGCAIAQNGGRRAPLLFLLVAGAGAAFGGRCCSWRRVELLQAAAEVAPSVRRRSCQWRVALLPAAASDAPNGGRSCYKRRPALLRAAAASATPAAGSATTGPPTLLQPSVAFATNDRRPCYKQPLPLQKAASSATIACRRCYKRWLALLHAVHLRGSLVWTGDDGATTDEDAAANGDEVVLL